MTGSIIEYAKMRMAGNNVLIEGRVRISVETRTVGNPGITVNLPNGKVLNGALNATVGKSDYRDGQRNGESTYVEGVDGASSFRVQATESYTNVQVSKVLTMYISPTVIKVR